MAVTQGDGAGYDVMSFSEEGEVRYLEVKTTRGDSKTAFYMSANELEFARAHPDNYIIYRVYDFQPEEVAGKFYTIGGDICDELQFTPIQYKVTSP